MAITFHSKYCHYYLLNFYLNPSRFLLFNLFKLKKYLREVFFENKKSAAEKELLLIMDISLERRRLIISFFLPLKTMNRHGQYVNRNSQLTNHENLATHLNGDDVPGNDILR